LSKIVVGLFFFALCRAPVNAQAASPAEENQLRGFVSIVAGKVFDYLEMAGTKTALDFRPLSQQERNAIFGKSLINPIWYFKGAMSGALDQVHNKPGEWGQGWSAYGQRVGNIMGQYAIQRSVSYGLASLLQEDNRYFGSGQKGFWRRSRYALASSVLARHGNGRQYPSVSQFAGFAAGAFISRTWQPPSTHTAGDGAVSFGLSMGYNALACEVKEFLPDLLRLMTKGRKSQSPTASGNQPARPAK